MTVGVRIRNSDTGKIVLDITDRLTRILGSVNTGTNPGSIVVPEFAQGSPWYYFAGVGRSSPFDNGNKPIVTISGNTLSWAFTNFSGRTRYADTIIYGLY